MPENAADRPVDPASLPRRMTGFGFCSAAGLTLDCGLFLALTWRSFLAPEWANLISASAAVTLVYFLSVRRVFAYQGRFLLFRFLVYALYQVAAISAASWGVGALARLGLWPIAAKLLVLPVTFLCNFTAMQGITRQRRPLP